MFENEKTDEVNTLTYLDSIINKVSGCSENSKIRVVKAHCVFPNLKIIWNNKKKSLHTKFRMLEATAMKVVKYGSEAQPL